MSVELPSWQPFADDVNVSIPNGPEPGRVVALLAPRHGTGESWAAGLAFDLATRWADAGHRIVLADAALEHPTLHDHVGLPNEEGLTDAARFGASVARIARPVPDRSFFLVTAGSPAGDGAQVAGSARWGRLVAGFGEAGVTLVLFLREGGTGAETFLAAAADIIVLAAPGDAPPAVPDEARARVRAVTGPDGGPATAHGTDAPMDGFGPADSSPAGGSVATEGGYLDRSGTADGDLTDPLGRSGAESEGGYAASAAGARRDPDSDPDARRKLIWVALVVLALVVFILVGAMRTG